MNQHTRNVAPASAEDVDLDTISDLPHGFRVVEVAQRERIRIGMRFLETKRGRSQDGVEVVADAEPADSSGTSGQWFESITWRQPFPRRRSSASAVSG